MRFERQRKSHGVQIPGKPRLARTWCAVSLAALLSLAGVAHFGSIPVGAKSKPGVGTRVEGFSLPDTTGKPRTLAEFSDKPVMVLVFVGTACPMSNSYAEPLSRVAERYAARGVQILGINANAGEDAASVAKHAREYRLKFPVLKDARQTLADQVGAAVTPEAFVLDKSRVIRYRGRLDDAYATRLQRRKEPTCNELTAAVEAVLTGKPVPQPVTTALGCAIQRPEASQPVAAGVPTFHKDVEPILQRHCQGCHRPGQVGPFSLLTYADAKNWAEEIKAFTQTRQMPPWKAVPGHGDFLNDRRMPDAEIAKVAAWVDAGAPKGNVKDAPKPLEFATDWMLGKPDLVLSMPVDYEVAATGDDDFRNFVLPTGLTEDKYVVAVEVRPGNSRVVHHVINFIDTQGRGRILDEKDPKPGYSSGNGGVGFAPSGFIGGWAPGNMPRFTAKGTGYLLPKGSDLVMQMHYHKTGKPEVDRTTIGLYFAKEPVEQRIQVLPFGKFQFEIPPGEKRYRMTEAWPVLFDATLYSVLPHMHLLGKEMKVWASLPDGSKKDLIWIQNWDYRWQDTYTYREPLKIPKGSTLHLEAYYDNSSDNPLNPSDPPRPVRFGEQTTDEMCFAFIEFVRESAPAANRGERRRGVLDALLNGKK